MAEMNDWNAHIISEFRANAGQVGGQFAGAPIVLMHHRGRTSGTEFVSPVMYLPDGADADRIFVFASKSGAPTHPDWYYNLTAAGEGVVEVGTQTYAVTVTDLVGQERERVFAEQAAKYPGFAEYAEKTAGIRTIPVLALSRR